MSKLVAAAAILFACSTALLAQETPKAELFTGFSYLRLQKTNQLGWNASVAATVNKNLAFVTDASGYYHSDTQIITNITTDRSRSIHSIMAGPRVSDPRGNFNPFAHALFGWGRVHNKVDSSGPGTPFSSSRDDNAFALALGAGIDYKMSESYALRIIQIDYSMLRSGNDKPQGVRVGGGVVFLLGKKK